ncbi:MAG: sodium-dependent bicarbonate transport family permease [Verrucomicrobia bacterium]|nr:sodium-dependent bicarbonate transport family permease [Verrucomicrobiota bacterium]
MNTASALIDPSILFFLLGIGAGLVRSNLLIPNQMARFLALYLLMSIGLKGGFALSKSGLEPAILVDLALAISLATLIPMVTYAYLRRRVSAFNAAAIAATYGSVSAVTFITAMQYLDNRGIQYGGHMSAALALMESPAILFAIVMANLIRNNHGQRTSRKSVSTASLGGILRESFTEGAQFLLLGSMAVGYISGENGRSVMQPFTGEIFKGMLAFFLLDMGLATASHLKDLKKVPKRLIAYGLCAPMVHAGIALFLCVQLGVSLGNASLLAVLAASASYIAVPAVLRHAIPEASPIYYLGLPLGLTFPFNILFGIPLYVHFAEKWIHRLM